VSTVIEEGAETGGATKEDGQVRIRCRQCRCCTAAASDIVNFKDHPIQDSQWCVPLVVRCGLNQESKLYTFELSEKEHIFSLPSQPLPLKVNPLHTGFYRCRYSGSLMETLLASFSQLPFQDQRGMISDVFALLDAKGDAITDEELHHVVRIMDAVSCNAGDCDTSVLQVYSNCVSHLADALRDGPERVAHETLLESAFGFMLPLADEASARSVKDCSPSEMKRRTLLISQALALLRSRHDEMCALSRWAINLGQTFLNAPGDSASSEADLLLPVLLHTVAFSSDHEALKDTMWKKLEACSGNAALSRTLLSAMSRIPLPEFVASLLTTSAEGRSTVVRAQVGHIVFHGASENEAFRSLLWQHFQDHQGTIAKQWGSGQFRIQSIVDSVGKTLLASTTQKKSNVTQQESIPDRVQHFMHFFRDYPLPNAALNVKRAAEWALVRHRLEQSIGPRLTRILTKRK